MKALSVGGLLLYGVANLFAGTLDLAAERDLPLGVDVGLVVTGGVLLGSAVLVARGSENAFSAALIGLLLASGLAVSNERVLGLGDPSHHLIRGPYTLVVLWASWRSTRYAH
jgi:hypothetical protein